MKTIFIFLFSISVLVATATAIVFYPYTPQTTSRNTKTISVGEKTKSRAELSLDSSWFDKNLDLYIQADYFSFSTVNYVHRLNPKDKIKISQECWLGNFTVADMTREKNLVKVDFSNEEFTKILFITPTYFVLTTYSQSENGMSIGSSLLYNPKTNTLKELESIIVLGINNDNSLECSKEQFSPIDGYVIEHGHFNIDKEKFIVEYTE